MFLSRSFFIAWRVVTASDCTKLKTIKIIVFFYKPIKWIYTNGFTLRECARGETRAERSGDTLLQHRHGPQARHVSSRWRAEQAAVIAAARRQAFVAHLESHCGDIP